MMKMTIVVAISAAFAFPAAAQTAVSGSTLNNPDMVKSLCFGADPQTGQNMAYSDGWRMCVHGRTMECKAGRPQASWEIPMPPIQNDPCQIEAAKKQVW